MLPASIVSGCALLDVSSSEDPQKRKNGLVLRRCTLALARRDPQIRSSRG